MDVSISFNLCPQVKSYVRVHGQPNDDDKGYVSISYNTYVTGLYYKRSDTGAHIYRLSLLCAFIFINILTPVALGKSASLYYPKIVAKFSTGEFMGCLYWATAIMAFLCNILYVVTSFRHHFSQGNPAITSCIVHHDCSIPSDTDVYKDEIVTLVGVATIIPSAVFIELLLSIYVVKFHFKGQRGYNFLRQYLLKILHVLALWNIMISIQLLTMIVLPICILLLIHPQVTILWLVFVVMIPVSLTLIFAYLLYHCQQSKRRRVCCNARCCGLMIVHLVVIVAILGLIIMLLVIYELVLLVQVQIGTGVKGILLSLLPSFPLSALGWYLKRRSQRKTNESHRSESMQLMTKQQQSVHTIEDGSDEEHLPLYNEEIHT